VGKCPISDLKQTIDLSERILLTAKGEQVPILKSVTQKIISGHEYFIENLIDITDRKRADNALKQANKKLNLLSTITRHDILNQLTVLRGYLALLKNQVTDPGTIEYIKKLETAAENIHAQISFTKDYQDIGVHSPSWYSLYDTVKAAESNFDSFLFRPIPDTFRVEVYADPLFGKVFINLIENAIRHAKGFTRITFSAQETEEGLIIAVVDDGVGIPLEEKENIFNRKYFKHTGLGLYLSREILAITCLSIRETGVPGKGARFEITVPKGMFRFSQK
jgi:signal transduction histidine kinase